MDKRDLGVCSSFLGEFIEYSNCDLFNPELVQMAVTCLPLNVER